MYSQKVVERGTVGLLSKGGWRRGAEAEARQSWEKGVTVQNPGRASERRSFESSRCERVNPSKTSRKRTGLEWEM